MVAVLEREAGEVSGYAPMRLPLRVEQRKSERVQIPLEMRWEGLSGRHTARIYDISMGGCYIESRGQVVVGERVSFMIQLPTGRWLPLRGEVRHIEQHMGFGLRLLDASEQELDHLSFLLDYARAA
jgi:hypothetical protein